MANRWMWLRPRITHPFAFLLCVSILVFSAIFAVSVCVAARMDTWAPIVPSTVTFFLGPGVIVLLHPVGQHPVNGWARRTLGIAWVGVIGMLLLWSLSFWYAWGVPPNGSWREPGVFMLIVGLVLGALASAGLVAGIIYSLLDWKRVAWRSLYCLFLFGIVVLTWNIANMAPMRDSESRMINVYWGHQQQFSRLIELTDELNDEDVHIGYDLSPLRQAADRRSQSSSDLTIEERRWQEYEQLLDEIGLPGGIIRGESGNTYFVYWTVQGADKGFVYAAEPPFSLTRSLDEDSRCCVKVTDNWYLYSYVSDSLAPNYE